MRRRAALGILTILIGLSQTSVAPPARSAPSQLTYSIKEARSYAYKASLRKEVIEALPECDPEEDPYQCDESKYNHKKNCPKSIAIGRRGKAPRAKPPAEASPTEGGAGDRAGPEDSPPQSFPVRINRLLSLGKLSNLSGLSEAGGLASSLFVDLSGRAEPEGHTQSEAFSNLPAYEERCHPENDEGEVDENAYEHFLSRSHERPGTYHLAECFERQCQFGLGINAERARAIVDLRERSGTIVGRMKAFVEGLSYGKDRFEVDSLVTHVRFVSDGTRQGLEWRATTTLSETRIGGRPVTLPPGKTVAGPGFSVGVAEPYVEAARDGGQLTIVAPGLHFGSAEQSAFFGGVELYASFGGGDSFLFAPLDPSGGGGDLGFGGGESDGLGLGGGFGSGPNLGPTTVGGSRTTQPPAPVAAPEPDEVRIYEVATGLGLVPAILAAGALLWFFMMSRWLQRFSWGRRLHRTQPLKTIDWVYRAFVKT
ncbi:MAG: hypothetical protein ACRDKB_12565 [Actinomycetota bacterium]